MPQGCRALSELPLNSKPVLLRVDFNLPIDKGHISDDTRLQAALPTIRYLLEKGARLILMSHLGSPKEPDPALSLKPISIRLSELLKEPVGWLPNIEKASKEIASSKNRIFLLENLRFFPGEKKPKDYPEFIDQLASLGGSYVNDAFGTAHREDGSCVALASRFKGASACGLLMQKEITFLQTHLEKPQKPFVAIVGGAKISSKLTVLNRLLEKSDKIVIVGAMAYTFLVAQGIRVGKSLFEPDCISAACQILEKAQKLGKPLLLPIDVVVCDTIENPSLVRLVPTNKNFPEALEGVDIGPQTLQLIAEFIKEAKTIFWNGPAGVFEKPQFAKGTKELAQLLCQSSAITIVGGGDSTAAVTQMGLQKRFSHVSTGGGASLELIEKGDLPALQALRNSF